MSWSQLIDEEPNVMSEAGETETETVAETVAETEAVAESAPVAESTADMIPATEPVAVPLRPRAEARGGFWWGTGRRKRAVARTRIRPGKGTFLINGRKIDQYFTETRDRIDVVSPLLLTKMQDKLDIYIKVHGGGFMGQAGAVKLGVSRALMAYDPSLEQMLRDQNMLTRDARKVERQKPGQPGARKRFQFSKR
jgi:small subunit ribosomal protein S9